MSYKIRLINSYYFSNPYCVYFNHVELNVPYQSSQYQLTINNSLNNVFLFIEFSHFYSLNEMKRYKIINC